MASTHTVCHIHLRHVDILGAASELLKCHRILEEGWVGHIRWWNPEGHFRSDRLLLVGPLGLHLLLPFNEFLQLNIVVLAEIAANSLYKKRQLALVTPTFCHQIGHHTTWFLPAEVRVLKFCAAHVGAKYREKHRDDGFLYVF